MTGTWELFWKMLHAGIKSTGDLLAWTGTRYRRSIIASAH